MNNEKTQIILTPLAAFATMIIADLITTWPTQLLWNYCLVPAVNGVNEIGFWQALGLNVLTSILFKATTSTSKK